MNRLKEEYILNIFQVKMNYGQAKERTEKMASVEKFTASAVVNQLRHNERTIKNPSNPDIDSDKECQNYSLAPDRGKSAYGYFKERKAELYCYGRGDVKVMCGWVVTAPKELKVEQQEAFF